MRSHSVNGRFSVQKLGSLALAACAAFAAFAITAPTLHAQVANPYAAAQTAIEAQLKADTTNAHLKATITLYTATPAALSTAVADLIASGSNAAQIATAAIEPSPVVVRGVTELLSRADRSTLSGPQVTEASIKQLIADADSTFPADAAAVTEGVAVVGGTNTKQNLTLAGQELVVKDALGSISDAFQSGTAPLGQSALLAADKAIGDSIATNLTSLPGTDLTTLLEAAIVGINGTKLTSTKLAPAAAEAFVAGVLQSGPPPNGATYAAFATSILTKVGTNAGVDELVAYQVGVDDPSASDLPNVAKALYTKYPLDEARIAQGLVAAIPAATGEAARLAFINNTLATAGVKYATTTLEGAVFADPNYSAQFTYDTLNQVFDSTTMVGARTVDSGPAAATADALAMAKGLGGILGQDGNALTDVSGTFATLIQDHELPVADAPTYATDLISGAVHGTIPASQFTQEFTAGSEGGALDVGNAVATRLNPVAPTPLATVDDLEAIEDVFANGVLQADDITSSSTKAAVVAASAEIALLAGDVAKFTANEVFTPSGSGTSVPVGQYLAGTLAEYIASVYDLTQPVGTTAAPKTADVYIADAIGKAIEAYYSSATNKGDIASAISLVLNDPTQAATTYPYQGAIAVDETVITNY